MISSYDTPNRKTPAKSLALCNSSRCRGVPHCIVVLSAFSSLLLSYVPRVTPVILERGKGADEHFISQIHSSDQVSLSFFGPQCTSPYRRVIHLTNADKAWAPRNAWYFQKM